MINDNTKEMDEVTVGIKSFFRKDKIKKCLESLTKYNFNKVIVTDDGKISNDKWEIYENMKEKLPLEILDLPFDSGIGYCRNKALSETETKYLLILDDDQVVFNIKALLDILKSDKDIGGVSGFWIENKKWKCGAHNLFEYRNYLLRNIRKKPKAKITKSGNIYLQFDFIPNSTLYRKKCLKDRKWDENYIIGWEHVDFYWGHKKNTDWHFAVTPNSVFGHYPGGSINFKSHRESVDKLEKSKKYFLDKWKFKEVININNAILCDPKGDVKAKIWESFPFFPLKKWLINKINNRIRSG